jgi:hypothetical protein
MAGGNQPYEREIRETRFLFPYDGHALYADTSMFAPWQFSDLTCTSSPRCLQMSDHHRRDYRLFELGMSIEGHPRSFGFALPDARVKEIVRMAEDNPRQAIAAVATLPESIGGPPPDRPPEFLHSEAYLGIARVVMKKNPSTAKDALEQLAQSLKHTSHPCLMMGQWIEGIQMAREINEVELALNLFQSGMEQADMMRSDDANPDDPNTAMKPLWPSVGACWRLVEAVSQISPQSALSRLQDIKDQEIVLVLELKLASKMLGARDLQSSTLVHKKSFETFGGCAY